MSLDNPKEERSLRKSREGIVVSDCQDKTIVVEVTRRTSHPLYKKVVKSTKKYYAHDESNEANVGDKVSIVETRPLSKTKRWRLVKVLGQS
jgi:small subunit ribosomal protein S17